jgi:ABC-type lipoprotein export system ATPase subunit
VVNLLPRFYDVNEGAVRVDGHDVREYELTNLRDQIALVSQEVVLFNDTIRANIAFGRDSVARGDRRGGARRARMEFAQALPAGLDTMVGDRGVLLSGGQRQRISIARALLKNAPILILDEATSALDTESERIIQAALEELMHNRTTLVIAHRSRPWRRPTASSSWMAAVSWKTARTPSCWRTTDSTRCCIDSSSQRERLRDSFLQRVWYDRHAQWLSLILLPLSWLFGALVACRALHIASVCCRAFASGGLSS